MNPAFFQVQMQRLITRFGPRAFDQELIKLIWREVHDLSEPGFQRFCDVLIGSRSANKPPLLTDFREARLKEQKLQFENELKGATQFLSRKAPEEMRKHLRAILSKEFGAVESVNEALEVATLNRQLKRANDTPEEPA